MSPELSEKEPPPLTIEEVLERYTALVHKIATGLARRNTDPVEDLIQVGMIGLLEAFKRYDHNQPATFKTYATHCITGNIRHYLRDKQNLVRGPRSLQELSYRLQQITQQLNQHLGREPDNIEIAAALQIPIQELQDVKAYERRVRMVWLDQEMTEKDDEKRILIHTLSVEDGSVSDRMNTRIMIEDAIEKLGSPAKELLRLRYFEDLTQNEIAKRLDMSQMEVCRKLKLAEKKLKGMLYDFMA